MEWTGGMHAEGYGMFWLTKHKYVRAHRWAYAHKHGGIPDGLVIDHLCHNRRCVNTDHLEAVPQPVNYQRGIEFRRRFPNYLDRKLAP